MFKKRFASETEACVLKDEKWHGYSWEKRTEEKCGQPAQMMPVSGDGCRAKPGAFANIVSWRMPYSKGGCPCLLTVLQVGCSLLELAILLLQAYHLKIFQEGLS